MKANLEFDLNDPDDRIAHERAIKSNDLTYAVWEFASNTKKQLEWELDVSKEASHREYELLDKVYQKFRKILEDRNIVLEKLSQ